MQEAKALLSVNVPKCLQDPSRSQATWVFEILRSPPCWADVGPDREEGTLYQLYDNGQLLQDLLHILPSKALKGVLALLGPVSVPIGMLAPTCVVGFWKICSWGPQGEAGCGLSPAFPSGDVVPFGHCFLGYFREATTERLTCV